MLLMKEGTDTIREILKTLHWPPPAPQFWGEKSKALGRFPSILGVREANIISQQLLKADEALDSSQPSHQPLAHHHWLEESTILALPKGLDHPQRQSGSTPSSHLEQTGF